MTAFASSAPDRMYVYIPGPTDDLDHEPTEIIDAEGLRASSSILCGVYRCGYQRVSHWIPAHPFLAPMPVPDLVEA